MKNKSYDVIEDPGHSWIMVPYKDLMESGVETKVSGYSYRNRQFVWLEEDCDAPLFCNAMEKLGYTLKLTFIDVDDFDEYMVENNVRFRFPDNNN
jgi:hypothetical protein